MTGNGHQSFFLAENAVRSIGYGQDGGSEILVFRGKMG